MEIKYNRDVRYRGKNSGYIQMGLYVSSWPNRVIFRPIHSKDGLGDCFLEIPIEDVHKLIDELKQYV